MEASRLITGTVAKDLQYHRLGPGVANTKHSAATGSECVRLASDHLVAGQQSKP